jgi:hypothetical protein
MSDVLQSQLATAPLNTSGWTAIRQNGYPMSYIRELSPAKVSPPNDARTIVLHESGAQVTIVIPFVPDKIEYLETHCVEIPVGFNAQKESKVIGCKCVLSGVELRSNSLSADKREMLLVFMEGTHEFEIALDQQGGLSVKRKE